MERLTEWIDEENAIPRMDLRNNGHEKCCRRLAAYEDIGLTPEQLRQIDQLYREKCEELARYKAAIAEARKVQQEDEIFYLFHLDRYNKGWKDAVEFIEGTIKEE